MTRMPSEVALPTLRGVALSRRDLLRRLAVLALIAPVGLATWRIPPWQQWQAQYTTGIGEQQSLLLPDGGSLVLNTATSVDVHFSDTLRLLKLYSGELLVQTAPDNHVPARPFVVETPQGQVQALGTRFIVRINNEHSDISVLDKSVRITPSQNTQQIDVETGQQISFTTTELGLTLPVAPHAGSWLNGSLVVVDMPLDALLAELSRYRKGLLSCSDDIAHLKISGAFPLNDTDRALTAITHTFPVRERRMTGYWVRLIPA
ncbi:FecR domain-containing protein [Nitrincola sp. A-D6]|uniref:FecR domain-containing protein n=1 Tax=Nitrincola sp. A-D6 TaxID=1545442 RepID=UPI00069138B6|nr:FecR domain-containing protein [Nitrincola sp. A-D6]